jgi:hypothetical protein
MEYQKSKINVLINKNNIIMKKEQSSVDPGSTTRAIGFVPFDDSEEEEVDDDD